MTGVKMKQIFLLILIIVITVSFSYSQTKDRDCFYSLTSSDIDSIMEAHLFLYPFCNESDNTDKSVYNNLRKLDNNELDKLSNSLKKIIHTQIKKRDLKNSEKFLSDDENFWYLIYVNEFDQLKGANGNIIYEDLKYVPISKKDLITPPLSRTNSIFPLDCQVQFLFAFKEKKSKILNICNKAVSDNIKDFNEEDYHIDILNHDFLNQNYWRIIYTRCEVIKMGLTLDGPGPDYEVYLNKDNLKLVLFRNNTEDAK